MVMKYESDVIQSPDHDVIMAPDSQTHVSTTAPSPYADVSQQVNDQLRVDRHKQWTGKTITRV